MGPLAGIKVVEMAGLGPAPFCGMMLSDLGADVIRIDRPVARGKGHRANVIDRGRKSLILDLKQDAGVSTALRLIAQADILIEGFRPGVMERLGLGPAVCQERNPGLVYGRMTGWGQSGPLAQAAGHDINYISLAGALAAMGYADRPPAPPLNLVGDFGGGALYLLTGVLAALLERHVSGQGQVVDAAMVDGTASMLNPFFGLLARGQWTTHRQANRLDGGAYYYGSYECSDGRYVSIGSLEPQFYALLLEKCGIDDPSFQEQLDQDAWPAKREHLERLFKTRTRDEWCRVMEGTDVCFAPVLTMAEAPQHPHNKARDTFVEFAGVTQAAPAPRFSRTHCEIQRAAPFAGEHTEEVLSDWGFDQSEIVALRQSSVI